MLDVHHVLVLLIEGAHVGEGFNLAAGPPTLAAIERPRGLQALSCGGGVGGGRPALGEGARRPAPAGGVGSGRPALGKGA